MRGFSSMPAAGPWFVAELPLSKNGRRYVNVLPNTEAQGFSCRWKHATTKSRLDHLVQAWEG
ncbi:hypothetical protein GCM10010869_05660 [Mesorhizobium tianshanense]|nr:hypothetical protein GCM10010869_05660 [Mesorhizobium tianshanense]